MKTRPLFTLVCLLTLSSLEPCLKASQIWAWGDNTYGQTNVPPGLTNVIAIAAGGDHCLALSADGKVAAWGNNASVPLGLNEVVAIAAYAGASIALKADGTVVVWPTGGNDVPANLVGVIGVAQWASASLALKSDGTVVGWPTTYGPFQMPSDLTNVVAVSGGFQGAAIRTDGTVTTWPDLTGSWSPIPADLNDAIAVSCGNQHNLALRVDGRVSAWGATPISGGPVMNTVLDVPVDLTNAVAVSAGYGFSLALRPDGNIVEWGVTNMPAVPPGATATAICASGGGYFALALNDQPPLTPTVSLIAPQNQTVGTGSQAFFSVVARGASPLRYQWFLYGTNAIAGATNKWLSIPNAHPSQSGAYSVVVSNPQGSATSQSVNLYVVPSLDIAMAPAININGEAGFTYRIEFIDKTASTNSSWTPLANVTLTNSSQYYCDPSAIGQPARFYRLVQVP